VCAVAAHAWHGVIQTTNMFLGVDLICVKDPSHRFQGVIPACVAIMKGIIGYTVTATATATMTQITPIPTTTRTTLIVGMATMMSWWEVHI